MRLASTQGFSARKRAAAITSWQGFSAQSRVIESAKSWPKPDDPWKFGQAVT
jgi:hypothetical protein